MVATTGCATRTVLPTPELKAAITDLWRTLRAARMF